MLTKLHSRSLILFLSIVLIGNLFFVSQSSASKNIDDINLEEVNIDVVLEDIDPILNEVSKYVSQDENGDVRFDSNAAQEDGQSEEVIQQGKLLNEFSENYNDNQIPQVGDVSIMLSLPVWGNWCGPGHGGGLTKDLLDEACKAHDLDYAKYGYYDCGSDLRLIARIGLDYDRMGFFKKRWQGMWCFISQRKQKLMVVINI